jgi:hypothetical protein
LIKRKDSQSQSTEIIKPDQESIAKDQQMKLELYRQNIDRKMGLGEDQSRKFETIDDRIIFYRFLGHIEIKDSHLWKMDTR